MFLIIKDSERFTNFVLFLMHGIYYHKCIATPKQNFFYNVVTVISDHAVQVVVYICFAAVCRFNDDNLLPLDIE